LSTILVNMVICCLFQLLFVAAIVQLLGQWDLRPRSSSCFDMYESLEGHLASIAPMKTSTSPVLQIGTCEPQSAGRGAHIAKTCLCLLYVCNYRKMFACWCCDVIVKYVFQFQL